MMATSGLFRESHVTWSFRRAFEQFIPHYRGLQSFLIFLHWLGQLHDLNLFLLEL